MRQGERLGVRGRRECFSVSVRFFRGSRAGSDGDVRSIKEFASSVGRTIGVIERKHGINHAHVNNFRLLFWFNYDLCEGLSGDCCIACFSMSTNNTPLPTWRNLVDILTTVLVLLRPPFWLLS